MLLANSTVFIFVALSIYESVLNLIFNLKKRYALYYVQFCEVDGYLVLKLLKTEASKLLP